MKTILLLLIITIILGASIYFFFFSKNEKAVLPGTEMLFPVPTGNPLPKLPESEKVVIQTNSGNVVTNNFLSKAEDQGEGVFALDKSPEYDIVYFRKDNGFIIALYATPLSEVRQKAENAFLQALGVSKEEACKLPATISVPRDVNVDVSGKNYKLSFCPGGISF